MTNIIGLFNSRWEAESAVQQLVNSGINCDSISIVSRYENEDKRDLKSEDDTSGAAKGAGIGAALGGVGGLVAGLAGLAIPGIGPVFAAGPIAAALGGALGGAGFGAAAGGLIGALTDMGVPEQEAIHYEDAVRQGRTLLIVRADDAAGAERVVRTLENCGAIDIDEEADLDWRGVHEGAPGSPSEMSQLKAFRNNDVDQPRFPRVPPPVDSNREIDLQSSDVRADPSRRSADTRQTDSATSPGKEEQLTAGKRKVASERVRIYGRVIEKPVDVTEGSETREEPVLGNEEPAVEERRKDVEVERSGEEAGHVRRR